MPKQSIETLIDAHGLCFYQVLLICLCGVIALVDGFDSQAIAFVTPLIAKTWHLPYSAFGLVFAAGLLGGFAGAVIFGPLADRSGRRITLLIAVAIFGIGSILTAVSGSVWEMELFRLLTGLGLGGAMPSIIALTAEYSPRRLRATLVSAMFCGFPLGAVLGALGSAPLMTAFGWRSVFWAGGLAPLVLFPAILFAAPESVEWLRNHGRVDELRAVAGRLGRNELWDGDISIIAKPSPPSFSGIAIFEEGRALGAVVIALVSFLSLLVAYLLVSWIPALAVQSGHTARSGVMAAAILNFSGICGSLLLGRASDRFNAYRVVSIAYGLGAAGALAIGVAGNMSGARVFVFSFLTGLLCIGAQIALVSLVSAFYPAKVRASGVGFSMAAGRVGAVAGPLVGSLVIDGPHAGIILAYAVALFSAAASVLMLLVKRFATPHAEFGDVRLPPRRAVEQKLH